MRHYFSLLCMFSAPVVFAAQTHMVSIKDYAYVPQSVEIQAGDEVRWVNDEKRTSHSVLFNHNAEESPRFFPGEEFRYRFNTPGEYPYVCGPHPAMTGIVVVKL